MKKTKYMFTLSHLFLLKGGPSKRVPSNPKEKLKPKKEQKQSLQSQDKQKVVPPESRKTITKNISLFLKSGMLN